MSSARAVTFRILPGPLLQSWQSQTRPSFARLTSGLFLPLGERGRSAPRLSCFRGTAVLAEVHSVGLACEVGKQRILVERPPSNSEVSLGRAVPKTTHPLLPGSLNCP